MDENYPVKLSDRSWALGNPHFNLYFVQGEKFSILIEAGISAVVDIVADQIRQIGLSQDDTDLSPDYIVVTHPHADHITGLDGLRSIYPDAVPIAGHGAVEFFTHPKAVKSMIREDRHITDMLIRWGWEINRSYANIPPNHAGIQLVADGNELNLGGITVRFIETKGHSPGSIAVFIPEIKLIAASDALGFRFSDGQLIPVFFTGFKDYLQSLDRLKSFQPDILCLGHQGILTGNTVDKAFTSAYKAAVNLQKRVRNHSGPFTQLTNEIFEEIFRDEFRVYSRENVLNCIKLLIHRSNEF